MKNTKQPIISSLLLCTSIIFIFSSYRNNSPKMSLHDPISGEIILANDTTEKHERYFSKTSFKNFKGVVIIDGKVENNYSKLNDSTFNNQVKKFVYREEPTSKDFEKYGFQAVKGLIIISTKEDEK